MTKHDDWNGESGFRPFTHNTMRESFYTGDIYDKNPGTGVMGRILGKFQPGLFVFLCCGLGNLTQYGNHSLSMHTTDVLKQNGLQTSANNVDDGMTMLSGDQMFNNPVFTGTI